MTCVYKDDAVVSLTLYQLNNEHPYSILFLGLPVCLDTVPYVCMCTRDLVDLRIAFFVKVQIGFYCPIDWVTCEWVALKLEHSNCKGQKSLFLEVFFVFFCPICWPFHSWPFKTAG